jgi:hypothetical protein
VSHVTEEATPRFVVYKSAHLDSTVWRVVESIPAKEEDFRSYAELGIERPTAHYLALAGVSTFTTLEWCRRKAAQWGLGTRYAELDLSRDSRTTWALTDPRTGHVTVWAPPSALYQCVLHYAEERED